MTDRNMTGLTARDIGNAIEARSVMRQQLLDTMQENPFDHAGNEAKRKAVKALDAQLRQLREEKTALEAGVAVDPIDGRINRLKAELLGLGGVVNTNAGVIDQVIAEFQRRLAAIDEKAEDRVKQATRRIEDMLGDQSTRISSVADRLDEIERKARTIDKQAPTGPRRIA